MFACRLVKTPTNRYLTLRLTLVHIQEMTLILQKLVEDIAVYTCEYTADVFIISKTWTFIKLNFVTCLFLLFQYYNGRAIFSFQNRTERSSLLLWETVYGDKKRARQLRKRNNFPVCHQIFQTIGIYAYSILLFKIFMRVVSIHFLKIFRFSEERFNVQHLPLQLESADCISNIKGIWSHFCLG